MLVVSGIIWAVSCLIPEMGLTTDIVIRSAAITIMFIAAILIFRLSDDAMNIWKQVIHAIRKY